MPKQLAHECHTEPPYLSVALPFGIEVGATLASSHAEPCESILESLLKPEELEDGEVDRGVKAQAALVGTQSRVVLGGGYESR